MITKSNFCAKVIIKNIDITWKKGPKPQIPLKKNNEDLIPLTHNLVFYIKTNHINIQYDHIYDKITIKKINLFL